jgi:hypothetical protein
MVRSLIAHRLILAVAAVAAGGWMLASLSASRQLDRVTDFGVAVQVRDFSEAELAEARDRLDSARRFNTDDRSLYAEIGLLILAGRAEQAVPVAERLVRLAPESFEAWRSLYGLTASSDPVRANQARARALELNPYARRTLPRVQR